MYDSKLPTADGTYTITDNATIPYGDTFSFTVTVADGYEETAPVVTSNGTAIEPASVDGNSYTYEIKLYEVKAYTIIYNYQGLSHLRQPRFLVECTLKWG